MRDLSLETNRTLWTSELIRLIAHENVAVGRVFSVRRGFARVQVLVDGEAFAVTVVDPEQEPPGIASAASP